ncbi:unnamed protein product [Rhodiola kirilowii]
MDGRGGCCIARYAGGGNANKMERVMLRFRPIAPKPATVSSDNKSSSGDTTTYVKAAAGRGKRKYNTKRRSYGAGSRKQRVRASPEQINNNNNNNNNKRARADESSGETVVVTLPLLPESPTESKTPTSRSAAPIWVSFNSTAAEINRFFTTPANSHRQQHRAEIGRICGEGVMGSSVTVECVTEMWVSGEGLRRTDQERVRNLEWDTCPRFITDVHNRVTWTNRAYKKMVVGDMDKEVEVVVWVAMKEKVPVSYPAFTCRVRVQHTCTKEIKILPCDVWRIDGGGFAWRLDVKAALSLGR